MNTLLKTTGSAIGAGLLPAAPQSFDPMMFEHSVQPGALAQVRHRIQSTYLNNEERSDNRRAPSTGPDLWYEKPVIIGTGSYGTAIANRLAGSDVDVMLLGRDPAVVNEINNARHNSKKLPGRELSPLLQATTSHRLGMLDRGVIVVAVPSIAIRSVIEQFTPHPESIVVSMAKGFIIEGWDPINSEYGLRRGPPAGCEVLTPLQLISRHPKMAEVKRFCVVAGPGFAADILDGDILDLAVASKDAETRERVGALLARQGTVVDMTPDTIGVETAAAMKNVIAIMVGVVDGLHKRFGSSAVPARYTEVVKRIGIQEASHLASALGGKHRTFTGPAGYPDLNLTTSSPKGRNYSLGMRLAEGADIDQLVRSSGEIVEGAWSAWAVKRLSDDRPDGGRGVYMPVTNALIDIFRGVDPSVRLERLMQELRSTSNHRRQEWSSGRGRIERAPKTDDARS